MRQTRFCSRTTVFFLAAACLVACIAAPQIGEADLQATIDARVRATAAAQAPAPTHTAQPSPTLAPTATSAARTTSTPEDVTSAPFEPQSTTETAVARAASTAETAPAATIAPAAAPEDAPITFTPNDAGGTKTINIELVFDASGSMAQSLGGETRIEAARRAMQRVIDTLPENVPGLNVGFRVYGHK